jgi:hypothetical protein
MWQTRFPYPALALGLVCLLPACDDEPAAPTDVPCVGSGGVAFGLQGALTTASPPFALSDEVSGCIRVAASAATPGNISTAPSDVIAFSFTIGSETWTGAGADFAGIFRFTISQDLRELFFQNAGGVQSSPGMYRLDVLTTDPDPTRWIMSDNVTIVIASAEGTMSFTR